MYALLHGVHLRVRHWAADSVLERVRVKHNFAALPPTTFTTQTRRDICDMTLVALRMIPTQTLVAALCQRLAPGASLRTVRIGQRAAALCESALVG